MERVGDGEDKIERHCSPGQSPQRAVAQMEEEDIKHKRLTVFAFKRALVWSGGQEKNFAPAEIRYLDRPDRSESLYRLNYPGRLLKKILFHT
jgi:hypothetical protein